MVTQASTQKESSLYSVVIDGFPGTVEFGGYGLSFKGKWASHTGYQSCIRIAGSLPENPMQAAQAVAQAHFEENRSYLSW